ncbi:MAG: hypothetical protein JWM68_1070 [Verrucomicrobiales bacterium]|nr:hypothetical protein [Verrucomicrobiales bacterium]
MSSHGESEKFVPLDLSRWKNLPIVLMVLGGIGALIGLAVDPKQFGYSWLLAFMFAVSLCMGGFFLTLIHHLFDASWSVPIRRINEHLGAMTYQVLPFLFIPIGIYAMAPAIGLHLPSLYPWMNELLTNPAAAGHDHALQAKQPLFTVAGFFGVAAFNFVMWFIFARGLKAWSLKQDETGAAECTLKMRFYASLGIFVFAVTLTLGAIMWMKALMHEWFSTMYPVYYFAGSVWMTLATVYLVAAILKRQNGQLREVLKQKQFYFIGSLIFAFTVFYAYVTFSQYFIIWNANMPEETFWYAVREKGNFWDLGMLLIFGHFFLPFLSLLRIDAKLTLPVMVPLFVWAWIMHFVDLEFNIGPTPHPNGITAGSVALDLACLAFMVGLLALVWLRNFRAHAPYPIRDPRLAEGLDMYVAPSDIATAPGHAK